MKKSTGILLISAVLLNTSFLAAQGEQKFLVDDPANRNSITFKSEAPLEDIVGTTNKVTGYVTFNPDEPTSNGMAEFTVPVSSLNSGIPLRDEHIRSAGWLNAEAYPDIRLKLDRVVDAELLRETEASRTFELTVSGELTLHGITRPVEMEARLSYLPESEKTRTRLPGNLLAVRTGFTVKLADFGITGPEGMEIIGAKVSETIDIEVSLFASTVTPAQAEKN